MEKILCNRLEFRDGIATGRLLFPVIRPRGAFARFLGTAADGSTSLDKLARNLGFKDHPEALTASIRSVRRRVSHIHRPVVHYTPKTQIPRLSVRESLKGKNILLIGATGFIGKVWLANLLSDLPEIRKIYLLIRRNRSTYARQRFERMVQESPVFDPLMERHGSGFGAFLSQHVEVVDGDAGKPDLGLDAATKNRLAGTLDLIVNSAGLTDFNPDLRDALDSNVDAIAHLLGFLRACDHAALLHLSTCYVAGARDGRILEKLEPNYTPANVPGFDAEHEWQSLHDLIHKTEVLAESAEVTEVLRRQALEKQHAAKDLQGVALENQIRKNRVRWLRTELTEAGTRRAHELGWPNTYTLTKGISESLIQKHGAGLPIADCPPGHRRIFRREAVSGLERGHQHLGVPFLSSWHLFPPASDERSQMSGYYPGRSGLPRHDADRRSASRAASPGRLPARDFGDQSLQYAPLDRADQPGASEALSNAKWVPPLAAFPIRRDSGFQITLSKALRASPKGRGASDQSQHRIHHAVCARAAGAPRA